MPNHAHRAMHMPTDGHRMGPTHMATLAVSRAATGSLMLRQEGGLSIKQAQAARPTEVHPGQAGAHLAQLHPKHRYSATTFVPTASPVCDVPLRPLGAYRILHARNSRLGTNALKMRTQAWLGPIQALLHLKHR